MAAIRRHIALSAFVLAACSHHGSHTTDFGNDLSASVDGGVFDAAHFDAAGDAQVDAGGIVGAVSLSNGKFCRDGVCGWVPKGMIFDGRVCPPSTGGCNTFHKTQNAAFSSAELDAAIATFHLDTIRFNVSQFGLDPMRTAYDDMAVAYYDAAYVQSVIDAVQLARKKGMSVIVTMQAEQPACNCDFQPVTPSDATMRAWSSILPSIEDDPGVMLEIFNEPNNGSEDGVTPLSWSSWHTQEQALLSALRAAGAKNVLVVDGVYSSHLWNGTPDVIDPANQLAHAIHGFPESNNTLSYVSTDGWNTAFGNFCATPGTSCLVTAWFTGGSSACFPEKGATTVSSPAIAASFLEYIGGQDKQGALYGKPIGLVGFVYDEADYFITGDMALTNFTGFTTCDAGASLATEGPGKMVEDYFRTGVVKIQ